MNPFANLFSFLMRGWWPMYIFWLLLLGSLAVALLNLRCDPAQRTLPHVWMWLARLVIGGMWWQQTLWKLPPTYTDWPDGTGGGLIYWVDQMAQHAAFGWHRALVQEIVQPHFYVFAPQVYAMEVIIAISLMLGLFTVVGGVLGAFQALNLWLGLYLAPHEWPWAYAFLLILQLTFAVLHAGRSLGLAALLARPDQAAPMIKGVTARVLAFLR